MRRTEIQTTLMEAIRDHFPADVSAKFTEEGLVDAARRLQANDKAEDYGTIDTVVRDVLNDCDDKDLDDIADGDIADPGRWFLEQVHV